MITTSFSIPAKTTRILVMIALWMLIGVSCTNIEKKKSDKAALTALMLTISGNDYPVDFGDGTNGLLSLPFGTDLTKVTIKELVVSPTAKASVNSKESLAFSENKATITVTAQDKSTKEYEVTLATQQPTVTTYTGTNQLGQAIKDKGIDSTLVITNVANVAFTWTLGTKTGTKTATNSTLELSANDFDKVALTQWVTGAPAVSFMISANGQTSDAIDFTYHQTEIRTWQDVQAMRVDSTASYTLEADIEFPDINNNNDISDDYNFEPIGRDTDSNTKNYQGDQFTGSFDGKTYVIHRLYSNRQEEDYVGLFGSVRSGSTIKNAHLEDVSIKGRNNVGGLMGYNNGTVSGYATGSVTGNSAVGGLVGVSAGGTVSGYATGSVTGNDYVGGFVGANDGGTVSGYATGSVTGNSAVGGLVGYNNGTVSGYATESVTGNSAVGGLVGTNDGTVSGYARGIVTRKSGSTSSLFGLVVGSGPGTCYRSGKVGESSFNGIAEGEATGEHGTAVTYTATTAPTQATFEATRNKLIFGTAVGEWTWTDGRWPAINLGSDTVFDGLMQPITP